MRALADGETIGSLLALRAAEHPDQRFLKCADVTHTYGELDLIVSRVAAGLTGHGLTKGTRLAALSGSRPEFAELYLACGRTGIVEVPLNAFLRGEFLRHQLLDSAATAIAVDAAGYECVVPLLDALPQLETIISFDEAPAHRDGTDRTLRRLPYAQLRSAAATNTDYLVSPEDLASILYTSGTTGPAKGCMISHGYALRFARLWLRILDLTPDDYLLCLYPLFHAATQIAGILSPMLSSCAVDLEVAFSATRFARQLADEEYTTVAGVGTHAALFLAQPAGELERQNKVRAMMFAPCPPETRAQISERFDVEVSASVYGQTECCPLTYSPLNDRSLLIPTSCGRAADDLEVAIVDDEGKPAAPGQMGEIVALPLSRFALFDGYWGNPEATEEAFRDGWYHTGDVGMLHEDQTLTFLDRKKNVIRRRGENISSTELEAAICCHPQIAEAAVFSVPSELLEDEIMAVVTTRPGERLEPEELFEFFQTQLPYFAVPRYVDVIDEIPRNALEKVMKTDLQKRGVTDTTWDFPAMGLVIASAMRRGQRNATVGQSGTTP